MICQRCSNEFNTLHPKVPVCQTCEALILLEWLIKQRDLEDEVAQLSGYSRDYRQDMGAGCLVSHRGAACSVSLSCVDSSEEELMLMGG